MENVRIEISSEVLEQEVSGETVLLDLASESYFGLDSVGTRIWQLLQEQSELELVYESMLSEYDVEAEQLEADLVELIGKLEDAGLVKISPLEN